MPEINPSCNGAGLTKKEVHFKDFNEIQNLNYEEEEDGKENKLEK